MDACTFCSLSKKQMMANKQKKIHILPTEEAKNGVEGIRMKV